MAMMKKQQFNPQPLLMFSFAAFLCPLIVTAGFQGPLDWELGLDEEMYNLQSEPNFYNSHWTAQLLGLIVFVPYTYYFGTCIYFGRVTDNNFKFETVYTTWREIGQRASK